MRSSTRRTPSRTSPEEEDYVPADPTGDDPSEAYHDAEGDAALDELLAASGKTAQSWPFSQDAAVCCQATEHGRR